MLYLLIPVAFVGVGLLVIRVKNQREAEMSAGIEAFRAGMGAIAPEHPTERTADGSPEHRS